MLATLYGRVRPPLIASLLLVALPALAIDVRYGVGVRSEVRARTPLPGDLGCALSADGGMPACLTGDLELDPLLDLSLAGDTTTLTLQYAPTLIWREPQTGSQSRLLPLQNGTIGLTRRWSQAVFTLTENAAWGLADIGALRTDPSQPLTAVNPVQTLGGVPYLRSATLMTLDGTASSRVSLGASAGFSISGSPEGTQNGLPLQYGPSGAFRLRWLATRVDALTTGANLFSARFITGQEQLIATLTETWDRPLSRTWSLSLGAGAALTREVVVEMQGVPGTYLEVLPVASASMNWNDEIFGTQPVRLGVSARLAPFADRFTGAVYERLEGRLQGDWRPARNWVVTAAGSGALAVPIGMVQQAGDKLVSGEAAVTWTAQPWLLLQASARVLWTEQPRSGIPGQVQAAGVVSVTIREQDSVAW